MPDARPLDAHERRALQAISRRLAKDDPALARALRPPLSTGGAKASNLVGRAVPWFATALAVTGLVAGVGVRSP